MENETGGRQAAIDLIVHGVLTGIGLALGAVIVALLLRLMGIRWNP